MPIEQAKAEGAMALFGEKYGAVVRVIDVIGFSKEFCGGTHVTNTSQLGLFKIISESSVAAGIRRIEGTTGSGVLELMDNQRRLIDESAAGLKLNNSHELPAKTKALAAQVKELENEIDKLNGKLAGAALADIEKSEEKVGEVSVFTYKMSGAKADVLRSVADSLKEKYPLGVVVLASDADNKVTFCAACGSGAVAKGLKAGSIVKETAAIAGGSGGGKPDIAMAGGKDAAKIAEALKSVAKTVSSIQS